jgi:hypothetical protein
MSVLLSWEMETDRNVCPTKLGNGDRQECLYTKLGNADRQECLSY